MGILIKGLGVSENEAPNDICIRTKPPYPYAFKIDILIRKQAKELAGLFYEGHQTRIDVEFATDDQAGPPLGGYRSTDWRSIWPDQNVYIAWCWPLFVKTARATLSFMLGQPHVPEYQKQIIYKALCAQWDNDAFNDRLAPLLAGQAPQGVYRR